MQHMSQHKHNMDVSISRRGTNMRPNLNQCAAVALALACLPGCNRKAAAHQDQKASDASAVPAAVYKIPVADVALFKALGRISISLKALPTRGLAKKEAATLEQLNDDLYGFLSDQRYANKHADMRQLYILIKTVALKAPDYLQPVYRDDAFRARAIAELLMRDLGATPERDR